jgi:hypothetical protein
MYVPAAIVLPGIQSPSPNVVLRPDAAAAVGGGAFVVVGGGAFIVAGGGAFIVVGGPAAATAGDATVVAVEDTLGFFEPLVVAAMMIISNTPMPRTTHNLVRLFFGFGTAEAGT